jgi:hypothetical protein
LHLDPEVWGDRRDGNMPTTSGEAMSVGWDAWNAIFAGYKKMGYKKLTTKLPLHFTLGGWWLRNPPGFYFAGSDGNQTQAISGERVYDAVAHRRYTGVAT